MNGTELTWLHISDIHLREETAWAQDIVLSAMLDDISRRYKAVPPDLIFITGDIAFSGKPKEYDRAEEFVRKLGSILGLELDRIFLVPGNHDIDRSLEEDAFAGAQGRLLTLTEVDRFFSNPGRRKTLFGRQRAFRDFINRLRGGSPVYSDTSYCHHQIVKVGAVRVRVLLIDSTWLAEGGDKDASNILVGERQILDFKSAVSSDGETLTFALMHHPFSWLREFEQSVIENAVSEEADICLRGHVHVADQRATETPQGRMAIFTAGAGFDNRTTANTYLRCTLDLSTGKGDKVTHRYVHHEKSWEASEPKEWTLLPAPRDGDARAILAVLTGRCGRPHYLTCLLAGLMTDIPFSLGERQVFASVTASIPGGDAALGSSITRLRFHEHWRSVWDESAWLASLEEMLKYVDARLASFTSLTGDLDRKEREAMVLLGVVESLPDSLSSLRSEVSSLIAARDIDRAREVMDRWLAEPGTPRDRVELGLVNIQLLLAENRPKAALVAAEQVLEQESSAQNMSLTAICAHHAGELSRAAALMHSALDAGMNTEEVRRAAIQIAGAAGDKALAERVRT
ncbi:MAG: metallophosphoesterase [Deltaproteobacteria bacterium]|nr:metallophosphoesterase [Deltaproteobacteria bacterium]